MMTLQLLGLGFNSRKNKTIRENLKLIKFFEFELFDLGLKDSI